MNKKIILIPFSVLLLLLIPKLSFAQGCSDAGFCTMGAMKPNQPFSRKLNLKLRSIEIGQYIGVNKIGDVIMSYTSDINIGLSSKYTVQVKIPYMLVFGRLANTNGLGDLSLSASRNLIAKEKYQLNFTIGTKIPTNNSNFKTDSGLPLPNYYQSSLGTYDIIAGISLIKKRWLFAAGYQQPLNQNKNEFFWGPWKTSGLDASQIDLALQYPVCRDLKRGNDVMLRIERNFRLARFNSHLGLLGIYRLNEDEFLNKDKVRVHQKGTTGLALSGIAGMGYNFSARSGIKIIFGYRLSQRYRLNELHELSLDGLSREFVNTIGYEFRF